MPIRFLMARDKKLLTKLLSSAMGTIFSWQRKQIKAERFEQVYPGAVTLIQNAGSAMNLHYHAHAVVLDGLFVGNQEEELCFVEIQPTTQDVMAILDKIIRKAERILLQDQEEFSRDDADDESCAYRQLLVKAVQTVHRSRFAQENPTDGTASEEPERKPLTQGRPRLFPACGHVRQG
jgi:hypothetical protein